MEAHSCVYIAVGIKVFGAGKGMEEGLGELIPVFLQLMVEHLKTCSEIRMY